MPDYTVFGYDSHGASLQFFRPDEAGPREAVAGIPTTDLIVVAVVEGNVNDELELLTCADIGDFRENLKRVSLRECRPSELIDYLLQFDDGDVVDDDFLDGFFEARAERILEED